MRINTVASNRLRYSPYAPLYDPVRFFTRQRRRSPQQKQRREREGGGVKRRQRQGRSQLQAQHSLAACKRRQVHENERRPPGKWQRKAAGRPSAQPGDGLPRQRQSQARPGHGERKDWQRRERGELSASDEHQEQPRGRERRVAQERAQPHD
jgi:hypothetical protein